VHFIFIWPSFTYAAEPLCWPQTRMLAPKSGMSASYAAL
jgi:hypothetical protein